MRRAAIALALVAIASCKKAEMPQNDEVGSPEMRDTTGMVETGGIPKITDTSRIPSEADTVRDSLKKP